jgi:hypothetical protein
MCSPASRRRVPDKAVVDQADAREHDAPFSCGAEIVEPLAPVARAAQLSFFRAVNDFCHRLS